MDNEILELDKAGLRRFAITSACLLVGVYGIVLPLLFQRSWSLWPWIAASVLIVWGTLLPARLRMIYRGWMKLAMILSRINSVLLLTILFLGVISPLGMLMRLFGYDPLQLKSSPNISSYRRQSVVRSFNHMEKPF